MCEGRARAVVAGAELVNALRAWRLGADGRVENIDA